VYRHEEVHKVEIKRFNELGKELDAFLRLKTHSLGINFFEKLEKLVSGLRAQQNHMNRFPIIYNLEIPFPVPNEVLKRRFHNFG
jgi:hypothetical protein